MERDLAPILSTFDSITLEEMDGVKLLDRMDTKFTFNFNQLPAILEDLHKNYKILNVNGINQNKYETLYFDTSGFKLYLDHHNGQVNRYKVRYRKYVDSDLIYFEIKHKNNKGRTVKSRIRRKRIDEIISGKAAELVYTKTPLNPESLQSKLWVNYSRITLVNKYSAERLTLDLNLEFINKENTFSLPNLVIAEVKQKKIGDSPFLQVMKNNRVREGGISKYCFGVISLIRGIKTNKFKPKLLNVNKVCYAPAI